MLSKGREGSVGGGGIGKGGAGVTSRVAADRAWCIGRVQWDCNRERFTPAGSGWRARAKGITELHCKERSQVAE